MSAESERNDAQQGIWLARPEAVPTDGISLAVKDLFDTAGLTTTYGSILFADHVPERSAEAVVRLERAGYVNVGKTNLHEFAYGVTSQNPHFGTVPNPRAGTDSRRLQRWLGRRTRGRARRRSARDRLGRLDSHPCCLLRNRRFKPSYGLVPLDGCFPLAPTFDHAGPMARTVADCRAMLEALAPEFLREPSRTTSQLASPGPTAALRSSANGSARRPRCSMPEPSTSRSRR